MFYCQSVDEGFFSTGNATILRRYRHTNISGSGFFIFSARCFWPTLILPLKWPFTKPLVLYCYLLFLAEHLYQILISSALRVSQAKALLWWMLICQKYLIWGQLVSHTELSLHICHYTSRLLAYLFQMDVSQTIKHVYKQCTVKFHS